MLFDSVAQEDYRPVTRTLQFTPSTRRQVVSIPIISDTMPEAMEDFTVRLQLQSNVSNVLLIPDEARVSIEDDDSKLRIWAVSYCFSELDNTPYFAMFQPRGLDCLQWTTRLMLPKLTVV